MFAGGRWEVEWMSEREEKRLKESKKGKRVTHTTHVCVRREGKNTRCFKVNFDLDDFVLSILTAAVLGLFCLCVLSLHFTVQLPFFPFCPFALFSHARHAIDGPWE